MKFKPGDQIEAIEQGRGFEKATVLETFVSNKGMFKGRQMYRLKIMNGSATMPIEAEINYKLRK